jgi:hypothetical protein
LVFYSDVLTYANLFRMLEHHKTCSQVATLDVCEVSDPTRRGIVTIDEKNVVREFVEKPQKPSSNLAFSGIIVCEPSLLDFIPNQIPADIGFHVLPTCGEWRRIESPITCWISERLKLIRQRSLIGPVLWTSPWSGLCAVQRPEAGPK